MDYFVELSKAFLTPIIAMVVAWIAYQQWRTNKTKLKFELYSKRHKVYVIANDFYSIAIANSNVTGEELNQYKIGIQEADFLFKADVTDYLDELLKKAVQLKLHMSRYRDSSQEPHPENYDHEEMAKKIYEADMWLPVI